jgi:hypothetical protein
MISVQDPNKKFQYWGFRLLIVIIPTLITSYFSYRSAEVESEGHSTVRTAAGYKATYNVIQDMQEQLKQQSIALATLTGEVQALRDMMMMPREHASAEPAHKGGKLKGGVITLGEIAVEGHVGVGAGGPLAPAAPSQAASSSQKPSAALKAADVASTSDVVTYFMSETMPVGDGGLDFSKQAANVYKPVAMPSSLDAALQQQRTAQ